jgi:hypothetical protein
MLPNAQHRAVEVEAVEHVLLKVLLVDRVAQHFRVALAHVFVGGHQKATRPAGGVDHRIVGTRGGQLHHQLDDMAGRAELAVLAGRSHLAQHILVEVALGIAVLHRDVVEHLDHAGQHGRLFEHEAGVAHVVGVGGAVSAQAGEEREDVVLDHFEHLGWREVLEMRPAQVLVVSPLGVFPERKEWILDGLLESVGLALFQRLQFIQAAHEQKVGELLDHREGIRDAS